MVGHLLPKTDAGAGVEGEEDERFRCKKFM